MSIQDYMDRYPIIDENTREIIFKDFISELMTELKKKRFTKIPATFRLIREKNDKWNALNENYILKGQYLGLDGFINRLKSKVPEVFDGGLYDK